jgi:uncharacterized SAM-binding protein YcdF (DUF218 family)
MIINQTRGIHMKVSKLKKEDLTREVIDKILYDGLEESGDKGDCIVVFGSSKANRYRVPKAASVYLEGRAPNILLCGGQFYETDYGMLSEAAIMKRKALELGIPEKDIILEELSMTTKENLICAALLLERTFKLCNIHSLLLVTTNYHMRRCLLMAQTYMPGWIKFYPCPADDMNTKRENWFKSEKGYQRAYDEVCKIISYINEKSISDFEI